MQPDLVAFKVFVEQKTRERVQCSLLNRVLVVLHRMRLENELQCSDRQADALNLIAEKVSREVAATLAWRGQQMPAFFRNSMCAALIAELPKFAAANTRAESDVVLRSPEVAPTGALAKSLRAGETQALVVRTRGQSFNPNEVNAAVGVVAGWPLDASYPRNNRIEEKRLSVFECATGARGQRAHNLFRMVGKGKELVDDDDKV